MSDYHSNIKKILITLLSFAILIVGVAWMAGSFTEKVQPGVSNADTSVSPANTYQVKATQVELFEEVPGGVEASQSISISARLLASVNDVMVNTGDYVKKGDVLVRLDSRDLASRLDQVKANLQSITAKWNESQRAWKRASDLHKKGLISVSEYEAAFANYNSLSANKESAAQAVNEAQTMLEYSVIKSPFDGVVVARLAEPGDMASPGMPLLTLYDPNTVRVEASVREDLAVRLNLGDSVVVEVPSLQQLLTGIVVEKSPAGSAASRSFLVKVRVNDIENLQPGMYSKLKISAGKKERLMVPREFVAQIGQLDVVWVLEDGKLSKRFVRTGEQTESGVEVLTGLVEGELLADYRTLR